MSGQTGTASIQSWQWSTPAYGGLGAWYDLGTAMNEALEGSAQNYWQIDLSEAGCWREDLQKNDCTWACQNSTAVWSAPNSTYTLHNCLAYPIIVELNRAGVLFDDDSVNLLNFYNIRGVLVNQTAPPSIMNTSVISTCLTTYCQGDSGDLPSGCSGNSTASFNIQASSDESLLKGTLPFNPNVCDGLDAEINPDIGGIGVFISYLMQIALVIIIWVTFHITQDWMKYGIFLYKKFFRKSKSALQDARDRQSMQQEKQSREDFVNAMRDFHVTQVFFMLAVQVAALIAIHDPKYLDSNSWQQFWNNVGILYDLAFGGALPILLIQVLLRQAGEKGWYTLFCSVISVALSAATWFRTYFFLQMGGENLQKYIEPEGPKVCGGVNPTKYCYSADWFFHNAVASKKAIPMVVFCLVIVVVMLIDQIKIFKHRPSQEVEGFKRYHQDGRSVFELVRDNSMGMDKEGALKRPHWEWPLHIVQKVIIFLTEVALLALTMILLKDYGRILVPQDLSYKLLDLTAWSFGQVIAVTIWFPVVCKYFWNLFETMTGLNLQHSRKKRDLGNLSLSQNTSYSGPMKEADVTVQERRPLQGRTDTFDSISDSERQ